jgi:hypothetical protein
MTLQEVDEQLAEFEAQQRWNDVVRALEQRFTPPAASTRS